MSASSPFSASLAEESAQRLDHAGVEQLPAKVVLLRLVERPALLDGHGEQLGG